MRGGLHTFGQFLQEDGLAAGTYVRVTVREQFIGFEDGAALGASFGVGRRRVGLDSKAPRIGASEKRGRGGAKQEVYRESENETNKQPGSQQHDRRVGHARVDDAAAGILRKPKREQPTGPIEPSEHAYSADHGHNWTSPHMGVKERVV